MCRSAHEVLRRRGDRHHRPELGSGLRQERHEAVERAGGRYLARTSRIETKPSTSRLSWPDERYYTGAEEKPPKPKPRRRSPHWPRSATAASSPGASLGTVHGNAIRTAMSSCTSWMVPRVSPSWRMVGRSLSR